MINDQEILNRVAQLRAIYISAEDGLKIDDIERRIRANVKKADALEMPYVQEIVRDAKRRIAEMNMVLLFSDSSTLSDKQRDAIIKQREAHQFWLDRFDPEAVKRDLEAIRAFVDNQVEEAGRE